MLVCFFLRWKDEWRKYTFVKVVLSLIPIFFTKNIFAHVFEGIKCFLLFPPNCWFHTGIEKDTYIIIFVFELYMFIRDEIFLGEVFLHFSILSIFPEWCIWSFKAINSCPHWAIPHVIWSYPHDNRQIWRSLLIVIILLLCHGEKVWNLVHLFYLTSFSSYYAYSLKKYWS